MAPIDPEYLRRETWSLREAAYLLADNDPAGILNSSIPDPAFDGRAAHLYANLKDATDLGDLPCLRERTGKIADRRVRPWDVVSWAAERGEKIPPALKSVVEPKPRPKAGKTPPIEKPLATNERNTLLTIIAALCNYSDIDVEGRGAAGQIARLTDEMGSHVTDDTVRKWLALIPDAVERRKK